MQNTAPYTEKITKQHSRKYNFLLKECFSASRWEYEIKYIQLLII